MPEKLYVSFSANAHASLDSENLRESYLANFRPKKGVVQGGALGFVKVENWAEDVRIAIEPSIGLPKSLFFTWQTRFLPSGNVAETLATLVTILQSTAEIYGVTFKPLI